MCPLAEIYQEFWLKFIKVVSAQAKCYPRDNLWIDESSLGGKKVQVRLKEPICLKSWPCNRSRIQQVDIVICVKDVVEVATQRSAQLVESATDVFYLPDTSSEHSASMEALHFHCHPNVGSDEGDPLLHGHVCSKAPEQKMPSCLGKRFRLPKMTQTPILHGSRIPTPQLSLPGVLCLLAADHLRGNAAREIAQQTSSIFSSIGRLNRVHPRSTQGGFWDHAIANFWYDY